MDSILIVPNAIIIIISYYALFREHRFHDEFNYSILIFLIANIFYMLLGIISYNIFDIATNNHNNTAYYIISCSFFILMFGLFYNKPNKLRVKFSVFMSMHGLSCWLFAINGVKIGGYILIDSDIIYYSAAATSWVAWCFAMYALVNNELNIASKLIISKFKS